MDCVPCSRSAEGYSLAQERQALMKERGVPVRSDLVTYDRFVAVDADPVSSKRSLQALFQISSNWAALSSATIIEPVGLVPLPSSHGLISWLHRFALVSFSRSDNLGRTERSHRLVHQLDSPSSKPG